MKVLILICIIACLPLVVNAGLYESNNPTALWQCRDSLRSLEHDSAYAEEARALLDHIPQLKKTLDRAVELIPSPRFRIDVSLYSDSLSAERIQTLDKCIAKERYHVVGADSDSLLPLLTSGYTPFRSVMVSDSICTALYVRLKPSHDPRLVAIRELVKKVQTEYDLISIGLAMKAYRQQSGVIWDVNAILVSNEMLHLEHLNKLLRLFKVQSTQL